MKTKLNQILAEISAGELIDKIFCPETGQLFHKYTVEKFR
jgi:hypothetical protein